MNYFNYFTEIEDTFIRRRGKHLLLSPMDWALIESWKEMGVPLHVALRGIESAFDSYAARPRRRSVKSLLYCQEEVEAQYAEWLDSQLGVGASSQADGEQAGVEEIDGESRLPFPRASIIEHLSHARALLTQICDERKRTRDDALCDALTRAATRLLSLETDFTHAARPDAERLDESLTHLEGLLDEALRASVSAVELAALRTETEVQLKPYRNRMERATYEQTLDNLLLKRLRDHYAVPRLSLFYL
ncbi:MAG: hypothetical protein WCF57_19795 [Pyrinomonadaceae bacterium]